MERLADRVELIQNSQSVYDIPDMAYGAGLTDTPRGAPGYWLQIENKAINASIIKRPMLICSYE